MIAVLTKFESCDDTRCYKRLVMVTATTEPEPPSSPFHLKASMSLLMNDEDMTMDISDIESVEDVMTLDDGV